MVRGGVDAKDKITRADGVTHWGASGLAGERIDLEAAETKRPEGSMRKIFGFRGAYLRKVSFAL
jgi:uncharacterized protein YebE (UPF0316 family)